MQLLVELAVANLLENVRVTGLVNLERFLTVRTDDFMHNYSSLAFAICLSDGERIAIYEAACL